LTMANTTSRSRRKAPSGRTIVTSLIKFLMIAVAARTFHRSFKLPSAVVLANTATTAAGASSSLSHATFATRNQQSSKSNFANNAGKVFKRVQVQIIHRHGDRSPITPLKDEDYWAQQLIPESTLREIAKNTVLRQDDTKNTHTAGGRGPFGKLSELGLLQMVKLGTSLREQLVYDPHQLRRSNVVEEDSGGEERIQLQPHIFTPDKPLAPENIRVISTNFPRTIQSVQGLLVGLIPDGLPDDQPGITIDVRHTDWMIPDPQPRRTREQSVLEEKLARRPHLLQREQDMLPLAVRVTKALHPLLAADAHEANFGTQQQQPQYSSDTSIEIEPLSWNQLAEVTKCLAVRGLLPQGVTPEDVEVILEHAAWCWFQGACVFSFAVVSFFVSY